MTALELAADTELRAAEIRRSIESGADPSTLRDDAAWLRSRAEHLEAVVRGEIDEHPTDYESEVELAEAQGRPIPGLGARPPECAPYPAERHEAEFDEPAGWPPSAGGGR